MKCFLFLCYAVLHLLTYIGCANLYRSTSIRSLELIAEHNMAVIENHTSSSKPLSFSNFRSNSTHQSKNRVKRSVMKHGKCAIGYAWYVVKCWPCNEYKEISGKSCNS